MKAASSGKPTYVRERTTAVVQAILMIFPSRCLTAAMINSGSDWSNFTTAPNFSTIESNVISIDGSGTALSMPTSCGVCCFIFGSCSNS